jgi:hypothetical protein
VPHQADRPGGTAPPVPRPSCGMISSRVGDEAHEVT